MFQGSLLLEEDVALDACVVFYTDTRWAECLEEWKTARVWGLDIETFGLDDPRDGLNPWKGSIRLIQVGLPSGQCLVLDLGGIDGCKTPQVVIDEFLSVLKTQLKSRHHLTVGQNLKFDLLFILCKYGFEARGTRDTMLMSQLYWAGLKQIRHSLKEIASRVGFGEVDKTEQTSEWWAPILTNKQINYASKDALLVIDIFYKLGEMLVNDGLKGDGLIECEALPAFVMMEYYGMPVDIKLLKENIKKYQDAEAIVLEPFTKQFPNASASSPKQLLTTLSEYLKKPLTGTSADDLAPYKSNPPIAAILSWRSLTTLLDYQLGMLKSYHDGAVRGIYRQQAPKGFGRSTCGGDKRSGRLGVNLQNPPARVPKELEALGLPHPRSAFRIPPNENKKLLSGDLSSAHSRLATEYSGDETLKAIYNDGLDMHAATASKLAQLKGKGSDWTIENITKWRKDKDHPNYKEASLLRQVAKPTFYGSLNMQGGNTLKTTAKTDAGIDMTVKEAKDAIKAWRETYNGLYKFQLKAIDETNKNTVVIEGKEYGVAVGMTGRRLFMLKMLSDFRPNDPPAVKASDCVSFFWTGAEGSVIKLAMIGFLMEIDKHPEWEAVLSNVCHDELCVTSNAIHVLDVAKALQANMQAAMQNWIKCIPVDDINANPEDLIISSWADH
ncbi:MAG: hypothetical protein KME47_10080 [Nodosilinea sp. WJT8-NPBG4]|jgi:DNA polymerase I-like protein with 3'-5' exonuclease and polymerase domains|nr:hypothetical protein [Nodosilinea sp. WJT8-NPBG4]